MQCAFGAAAMTALADSETTRAGDYRLPHTELSSTGMQTAVRHERALQSRVDFERLIFQCGGPGQLSYMARALMGGTCQRHRGEAVFGRGAKQPDVPSPAPRARGLTLRFE